MWISLHICLSYLAQRLCGCDRATHCQTVKLDSKKIETPETRHVPPAVSPVIIKYLISLIVVSDFRLCKPR